MFSQRTAWNREETALAQAVRARSEAGLPLIDLAASNPTRCHFQYDAETLLTPLADAAALVYDPAPLGMTRAREAVCGYYRERDVEVSPSQVCLTTSTSEAYSSLFRLLCDVGDEVLIAQPTYPLFEFLSVLDDVRLISYPLFYDHGWQTQPRAMHERITSRTRAIVVVHPNNPTGHYVSAEERLHLEQICVQHDLALIVDEVFLDYSFYGKTPPRSFAAGASAALTFVLSGLSKIAGLPQMKTSWIVTTGPGEKKDEALARLEVIADTFLSMNTPVQHAMPQWIAGRAAVQQQIVERTRTNLATLDRLLAAGMYVSRLTVEAGWYAVLRVPALGSDEELVLALVRRWGVLVHPGYYYGFKDEGWLVVSLLPAPDEFKEGIKGVLACCLERVKAGALSQ